MLQIQVQVLNFKHYDFRDRYNEPSILTEISHSKEKTENYLNYSTKSHSYLQYTKSSKSPNLFIFSTPFKAKSKKSISFNHYN